MNSVSLASCVFAVLFGVFCFFFSFARDLFVVWCVGGPMWSL